MPKPLIGLLAVTILFVTFGGISTLDPPWFNQETSDVLWKVSVLLLALSGIGLAITRPN